MKKKNVLVVIPVRSGSKRISNKNIRKFLGRSLIGKIIQKIKNYKVNISR